MEIAQIGALSLAYVGDAHYSLKVREYLVTNTTCRPNELQRRSTHYCSAKAQAGIFQHLMEEGMLSEAELDVFKRGRNCKSHAAPKNTDVQTYHISTGFETLWGYWYLTKNEARLEQIWDEVVKFVEG